MTILQKLEAYESAVVLLNSIPDYPWPQISRSMSMTVDTDKTGGKKNIQTWFEIAKGWKVVVTERWTDGDGKAQASRVVTEDLTAVQASTQIDGEV